jgi:hypothetical protein
MKRQPINCNTANTVCVKRRFHTPGLGAITCAATRWRLTMLTGCKIDSRFLDRRERDVRSGLERGTERPFVLVHENQVQWHLGLL